MDPESKLLFDTPSAFMREVRLCWHSFSRGRECGLWMPETVKSLAKLEHHMNEGCEVFGEGTHWLEHRVA